VSNPESAKQDDAAQVQLDDLVREMRSLRVEVESLRREIATSFVPAVSLESHPAAQSRRRRVRSWTIGCIRVASGRSQDMWRNLRSRRDRFLAGGQRRDWAPPHPLVWDFIALLLITTAAFLLRFVRIDSIPPGMHGDEAATGLGARQIMSEGWIGVYTGRAGGNPTGDYYLAVPFLKWISDPILAVRSLSVTGGTIAVIATYVLARRNAGFVTAIIAASLLAISEWAIAFSRMGSVTGNWLPSALVGAICLQEAIRSGHWGWWLATGITLPSAIYIYNGHTPLLIILVPLALASLIGWRALIGMVLFLSIYLQTSHLVIALSMAGLVLALTSPRLRQANVWLTTALFVVAGLAVSRGMIRFAHYHNADYFGRSRQISVFKTDAWRERSDISEKVTFLVQRYWEYWQRLTFRPIPDGADLTGVTPLVPPLMFAICAVGLVLALLLRPSWFTLLCAAIVLGAPLSPVLTDLTMRRALIILPFGCMLAALGMSEVMTRAFHRAWPLGILAGMICIAVLVRVGQTNYSQFFDVTVHSQPVEHTFAIDYRYAAEYVLGLPPGSYILYFNDRALYTYDTGALIDRGIPGEDRLPKWGGTGNYEIDWTKGRPVFLLLGADENRLSDIEQLYPNGTVYEGQPLKYTRGPSFIAYFPPLPHTSRLNRSLAIVKQCAAATIRDSSDCLYTPR